MLEVQLLQPEGKQQCRHEVWDRPFRQILGQAQILL